MPYFAVTPNPQVIMPFPVNQTLDSLPSAVSRVGIGFGIGFGIEIRCGC